MLAHRTATHEKSKNNVSSDVEDDYSKISMKQSNSFGNLMDSNNQQQRAHESNFNVDTTTMKRNKSFWRFSKSEDILEGMALWKHRDLVPIDGEFVDSKIEMMSTLQKPEKVKKLNTLQKKAATNDNNNTMTKSSYDTNNKKMEKTKTSMTLEKKNQQKLNEKHMNYQDDNIYDETPKKRNDIGPPQKLSSSSKQQQQQQQQQHNAYDRKKSYQKQQSQQSSNLQDTNFYEDDIFVMKTVKRKEILKQYYSSGTDTELSSSDPYDPYDCIIVQDHHLTNNPTSTLKSNRNSYAPETSESRAIAYQQRANKQKTESLSGTLLPRTKLSKSIRSEANDFDFSDRINTTTRSSKIASKEKWSNLWSE
jgi:BAI1-associated protein 2